MEVALQDSTRCHEQIPRDAGVIEAQRWQRERACETMRSTGS